MSDVVLTYPIYSGEPENIRRPSARFPLERLGVHQYFDVPEDEFRSLRVSASKYKAITRGWNYMTRKMVNESGAVVIRIWRTA